MAGGYISIILSESGANTTNNTSVVTANVYYYGNGVSWSNYSCPGTIVLGGTSYSFSNKVTKSTAAQWIGSASKVITHNADGSGSVSCSATFTVTGTSLGTLSASNSLKLTTIPRASVPTLSSNSVKLGEKVTVYTHRVSTSFNHIIKYSIGNASGKCHTTNYVATDLEWTVPLSLANQLPNNTSGVVTIIVETYNSSTTFNSSTLIGTKTVNFTVTVPDTETFKPSINTVNVVDVVEKVKTAFGLYAQSLSQLKITITAAGAYGSTIKSYITVLDGVTYNADTFTSNTINGYGNIPIKVTVTDSRGRTATKTVNVEVVEYVPPEITKITYKQCNEDGTENGSGTSTKVTITGKVASVSDKNSRTLVLRWRNASESTYQSRTIPISEWDFTVSSIINNIVSDETYEFMAVLTDKIMSVDNKIQTGKSIISFHAGGDGVTIGKQADKAGFDCAIDAVFEDLASFKAGYGYGTTSTSKGMGILERVGGGWKVITSSANSTGILKIILPNDFNGAMVKFDIDIYSYTHTSVCTYTIGGQIYKNSTTGAYSWAGRSYSVNGTSGTTLSNLPISFGRHNGKAAVSIGSIDTTWGISDFLIKNFSVMYTQYSASNWNDGWSIILDAKPLEEILNTVTKPVSRVLSNMGIADYVVEQGISGIWTWRKWNSGVAECWAGGFSDTFTADGSLLGGYLFRKVYNFPVGLFASSPIEGSANGHPGTGVGWGEFRNPSKDAVTIYFCGNQNTTTVQVYGISAKGKWK